MYSGKYCQVNYLSLLKSFTDDPYANICNYKFIHMFVHMEK